MSLQRSANGASETGNTSDASERSLDYLEGEGGSSDSEDAQTEETQLLAIVFDVNPTGWGAGESDLPDFKSSLEQLMVFINAYLANTHHNYLTLIAAHSNSCEFIYPSDLPLDVPDSPSAEDLEESERIMKKAGLPFQFRDANLQIKLGIDQFLETAESASTTVAVHSSISAAISKAICYIHQTTKQAEFEKISPRILVISASPDAPHHYIPMMNSIFSAQRLGFPIDTIKISGGDSMFLQQASHITGGRFVDFRKSANDPSGSLIQYLIFGFLPGSSTRNMLISPGEPGVDFRAACFCHKTVIDVGYVCSVCLSIFCKSYEVCSTCRSKFSIDSEGVQTH
ncbi:RNA polymerase II transcription factor B subunit 4 [Entomophthora muscae]|uniref:RNA polymerase II transcription factor B subunit 4 n=1 Tax=Entomophthora muscae TaxID=34485 RepID=A0ACC2UF51_9FUNG|nr:RNA polymerase II transcription factor B subunit 4 [Entomophthora muscae]